MDRLVEVPEAGADRRLVGAVVGVDPGFEEIAGEVLGDEAVVGHVAVEGADDPVPVPPGLANGIVELVAAGLRVANEVEPVTTPSLAEVR